MNKNDRQFLAQEIRTRYMEKKTSELDALCALDRRVKRPPTLFAYLFGSLGAIIMGSGMSLIMTDLAAILGILSHAAISIGILIGAFGIAGVIAAYPIYQRMITRERRRLSPRILQLTDSLLEK